MVLLSLQLEHIVNMGLVNVTSRWLKHETRCAHDRYEKNSNENVIAIGGEGDVGTWHLECEKTIYK